MLFGAAFQQFHLWKSTHFQKSKIKINFTVSLTLDKLVACQPQKKFAQFVKIQVNIFKKCINHKTCIIPTSLHTKFFSPFQSYELLSIESINLHFSAATEKKFPFFFFKPIESPSRSKFHHLLGKKKAAAHSENFVLNKVWKNIECEECIDLPCHIPARLYDLFSSKMRFGWSNISYIKCFVRR